MKLSDEDRRALFIIAALLLVAAGARWLERPRPILEDVPALDLGALEQASRAALETPKPRATRKPAASTATTTTSPGRRSRTSAGASGPVRLSTATAAELETLPGIGPALSARLIARRDSIGGFRDWAQVDSVRGVGPALLARLREQAVLR